MLPAVDNEGFLRNLDDWNQDVAQELARLEDISLTLEHWEVISLAQAYYREYLVFPANRVLVKKMKETLGEDKGSSIHLMTLFTGKPARVIAKVAGLPKPPNCD
jgi:tRNA 2-thiouridine synthesizing protein E